MACHRSAGFCGPEQKSEQVVRLELVLSVSPMILEEGNIQQNRNPSKPSDSQARKLDRLCHVRTPSLRSLLLLWLTRI